MIQYSFFNLSSDFFSRNQSQLLVKLSVSYENRTLYGKNHKICDLAFSLIGHGFG